MTVKVVPSYLIPPKSLLEFATAPKIVISPLMALGFVLSCTQLFVPA
jgi:hypothetical protein